MQRSDSPNRREDILIDQKLQIGLTARLGVSLLLSFALFVSLSFLTPWAMSSFGFPSAWLSSETKFRADVLSQLALLPLLCSMLTLFAHGILETFKIAGPNYRMQKIFGALSELRIPRGVGFRKSDYLQDTGEKLNSCLVAMHDHVAQLQQASSEALNAMQQVAAGDSSFSDIRDQAIRDIDDLLHRFELSKNPWNGETFASKLVDADVQDQANSVPVPSQ